MLVIFRLGNHRMGNYFNFFGGTNLHVQNFLCMPYFCSQEKFFKDINKVIMNTSAMCSLYFKKSKA